MKGRAPGGPDRDFRHMERGTESGLLTIGGRAGMMSIRRRDRRIIRRQVERFREGLRDRNWLLTKGMTDDILKIRRQKRRAERQPEKARKTAEHSNVWKQKQTKMQKHSKGFSRQTSAKNGEKAKAFPKRLRSKQIEKRKLFLNVCEANVVHLEN